MCTKFKSTVIGVNVHKIQVTFYLVHGIDNRTWDNEGFPSHSLWGSVNLKQTATRLWSRFKITLLSHPGNYTCDKLNMYHSSINTTNYTVKSITVYSVKGSTQHTSSSQHMTAPISSI